jgi:hypothetical protein
MSENLERFGSSRFEGRSGAFERLFELGKQAGQRGRRFNEDFTTEVLAIAVRENPDPLARFLSTRLGIDRVFPCAFTQQHVQDGPHVPATDDRRNRARLDLVVRGVDRGERDVEVWIEIKAGSPLRSRQLKAYCDGIHDAEDGEVERRLFILGINAVTEIPDGFRDLPWASWQELHDEIRFSDGIIWRDFTGFLRSRGLAKRQGSARGFGRAPRRGSRSRSRPD